VSAYFVSRHPGALDWATACGIGIDHKVEHLDLSTIGAGDKVIGTLPVNLAAAVCARGARYLHLSLDLPAEWRGRELSAADMQACGARIEEYRVERVG
jgi:CRISPR-associated protein Csx16